LTASSSPRGPRRTRRPDPRYPRLILGASVAALCIGGGVASAQTVAEPQPAEPSQAVGNAPEAPETDPAGETAPQASTEGTGATAGSAATDGGEAATGDEAPPEDDDVKRAKDGAAKLKLEKASPEHIFYNGQRRAKFRFAIGGSRARDVRVQVVKRGSGRVGRGWRVDNLEPGEVQRIRWRGMDRRGGELPDGRYFFRVMEDGETLDRSRADGNRRVDLYGHKFPLRARHGYGDGYGAGRGHQGVDIFSRCGAPLVAARAGRVQWRAYQGSGAGYYVVIDGKRTNRDYVYMHLRRRARVHKGERVRTGEPIARVGETGNAQGCHLHLEVWQGNWYGGGHAKRNVKRIARRWDRWS
jgi:murein DD-endopeptidase MepM/ murein hydrolase activator NlpD